MVFSSLFFVFLFLPLNLLIYKFMPSLKARNIVMLVFSLIFYAWGEPLYVLLLLFMTLADWFIALYIERQENRSAKAKLGLFMMGVVNLSLLGVFKYGGFILGNIQYFTGFPEKIPQILLPIGISFYTFQLISYVVDVYRGEVPAQKKFWMLLLYVSLFHQCIAGPIVRYKDVCGELLERRATSHDIAEGIWRFSFGLAKKAILANACGNVADTLLPQNNTLALWVGMLAYALQIYLDFSAYSDMAIGMGRMIGIHYLENFDYPYSSRSVTEFWRRWHMSLGSFFRDYVYIPLGGNRKGRVRTYLNLLIVWFLTGLWHGASWNFVLWGLYFFVFLAIEKIGLLKLLSKSKVASHIYLLLIVYFGWILFRFTSIDVILTTLKTMFFVGDVSFTSFETTAIVLSNMFIILFSAVVSTPVVKRFGEMLRYSYMDKKGMSVLYAIGRILIPIILLVLSTAALVGDSYNPFLYFQF